MMGDLRRALAAVASEDSDGELKGVHVLGNGGHRASHETTELFCAPRPPARAYFREYFCKIASRHFLVPGSYDKPTALLLAQHDVEVRSAVHGRSPRELDVVVEDSLRKLVQPSLDLLLSLLL